MIRQGAPWRGPLLCSLLVAFGLGSGCGGAAVCGDGVCDPGEGAQTCPMDCAVNACGDGQCTGDEGAASCPVDCYCGNGSCDPLENGITCARDCTAGRCGNLVCELGENNNVCPVDCPDAECGNGACEAGEDMVSCPGDCTVSVCGNGVCESLETTWSCVADCVSVCGNGVLENGEGCDGAQLGGATCSNSSPHVHGILSCEVDCHVDTSGCYTCGNGVREPAEDCDGADLGNDTCATMGYDSGTLQCAVGCTFELAGCALCGNGVLESSELCDTDQFVAGAPTCEDLGHQGGTPGCAADCQAITDTGCYECGNGMCEADLGEGYAACPEDCAFTAVYADGPQTCAIRADGTAWCWGCGFRCQIGDGNCLDRSVPTRVQGLTNVVRMAVGDIFHNCALLADGTAWCWGENPWGQLGDGTVMTSPLPVAVANLSNIVALEASMDNTCAVLADGTTWCWGWGGEPLGIGNAIAPDICQPPGYSTSHECSLLPLQTITGSDGVDLAMESSGACLLESAGTVWCWGLIWDDSVGGGRWIGTPDPVDGTPLGTYFDYGPYHGCIIDAGNDLWCWGAAEAGQLGDGATAGGTEWLTGPVAGLPPIVDVAPGGRAPPWSHTCALDDTGHVWCWGYNYRGQLGDGTFNARVVPAQVPGLSGIVQITAGGDHTCALDTAGAIWCWGHNSYGELGDGTNTTRPSPVPVAMP